MLFIPPSLNYVRLSSLSELATVDVDSNQITIPATARAGDFAIFFDGAADDEEAVFSGSDIEISGWTKLVNQYSAAAVGSTGGVQRAQVFARILQTGDAGTAVTGTSVNVATGARRKAMAVFRGNRRISSYSVHGSQSQFTTGNPTNQTLSSSSGTSPLICFGFYRAGSIDIQSLTFTPTATGSITNGNRATISYLIQNSSPANITSIDMGDSGSLNFLASLWIEFT